MPAKRGRPTKANYVFSRTKSCLLSCEYPCPQTQPYRHVQGNLSLDHYDDSQHSRDSLDGPGGGIGALGVITSSLAIRASSGFPRENSGGISSSNAAPWGSGMGGGGKADAGGAGGGQHYVVPGGIWLPTPRTQGTSSFSPSSSAGGGGGGGAGGGGGGSVAAREREEGGAESRSSAANGGFFGGNEPHCARCSNADAGGQAQVSDGGVLRRLDRYHCASGLSTVLCLLLSRVKVCLRCICLF